MAGLNRRLTHQGQPVTRHSLVALVPAPWSGTGLGSHVPSHTRADRGHAHTEVSESAHRHHLEPRPTIALVGSLPTPFACCSFVGG